MIVLAVDPGATGALVLVDMASANIISAFDMPSVDLDPRLKTRRAVDLGLIDDWLEGLDIRPDMAAIEGQQPRPTDAASSAFVLGMMYGAITSYCFAAGHRISFVTPARWKRAAGLEEQSKAAVLDVAAGVFGRSAHLQIVRGLCSKAQAIARADAACMCWFGLPEFRGVGRAKPVVAGVGG